MENLHIDQDDLIAMTSLKFALHLTCLCVWRLGKFGLLFIHLELFFMFSWLIWLMNIINLIWLTFSLFFLSFSGLFYTLALTTDPKSFSFVNQVTGFINANVGESWTLECSYDTMVATQFYWFKQTLGQKPRLISVFYRYDDNASLANEFKNDPRIKLDTTNNKYNLKISNLRLSDSATYYCAGRNALMFEFAAGITVNVKGSDVKAPALIYQPASETDQAGASGTLDCTVNAGTCDREHSVYWFRHSGESQPGLIYTRGRSNDRCQRKNNTQTNMCFYDLPMNSLNVSKAETYLCAVASCGNILFGDRDKLGSEGKCKIMADWYNKRYNLSNVWFYGVTVILICVTSSNNDGYVFWWTNLNKETTSFHCSTMSFIYRKEEYSQLFRACLECSLGIYQHTGCFTDFLNLQGVQDKHLPMHRYRFTYLVYITNLNVCLDCIEIKNFFSALTQSLKVSQRLS